jgi:hypothetical protein
MVFYYSHFFLIRFIIITLIALYPLVKSTNLWKVLTVIQVFFFVYSLRKVFLDPASRILSTMHEIQILIIICVCTTSSMMTESSVSMVHKCSYAIIYGYIYIVYNLILFLVNVIVRAIQTFRKYRRIFCKHHEIPISPPNRNVVVPSPPIRPMIR